VGVFVEESGPAVHFEGQVGDFHLRQEPFHLAAQGDQCDRLGVGIQRGEHDLVAAFAVFDAQVGVGGVPGGGASPCRIQSGRQLADDGGRLGFEGQVVAQRLTLVSPGLR